MSAAVSILLPNLNNRAYLDERVETILSQTLADWELVVVDNHSEDGAWEFFQKLAGKDDRVKISQAPREGMYPQLEQLRPQSNRGLRVHCHQR
jgi:glycosyltransferase involved in cell wall biosynthesis